MKRKRLTIYRDESGGWRWSYRATNGRIIGASSESFRDRNKCIANASAVTAISGSDIWGERVVYAWLHGPVHIRVEGKP